jgi:beta-ribofuranosylaminobenzene 5'-phosphate synthase
MPVSPSEKTNQKQVIVKAPSRLAFTLINLGIGSDRINGGAGVALSYPRFRCSAEISSTLSIDSKRGDEVVYNKDVTEFLMRLLNHLDCPPVRISILEQIPSHLGFGSKTATLLGIGRAVASLYGKKISTPELAVLAQRAGTSGIGVNVFDQGGFIVDGGHPVEKSQWNRTDLFVPSRFSSRRTTPPVLFHSHFPWPFLIVIPKGRVVEGENELAHFQRVCPIPQASVFEIAHIVCFRMVSSLVELDYQRFCWAVNDLQRTYWKASQIKTQSDELQYVINNASKNGFEAIGISSNGPALYGLTTRPEQAMRWLNALVEESVVNSFWLTNSAVRGASVRSSNVRMKE